MMLKRFLMTTLPFVVLAFGVAGAVYLVKNKPEPQKQEIEIPVPLVRTRTVDLRDAPTVVTAQGTVSPRTEIPLFPEVSGRVVWISPSLADGGFFEAGDALLRIDRRDLEFVVTQAKLKVAEAELRLAREQAEAEVARKEWKELRLEKPSPLTLREPQLAEAKALVESARANLQKTELDLERTEIRAPFAGRVREKNVDIGQVVARGNALATLYAVDFAEVRFPISHDDLGFVDLPVDYRGEADRGSGPRALIRARLGGRVHEWQGRIVRTDGEIDPRTRLVHAIAQVEDPYARGADPTRPPLAVGLFVTGEIVGRELPNVALLPRSSLRGEIRLAADTEVYNGDGAPEEGYRGTVLVVDENERLHFRTVSIARIQRDTVLVDRGLVAGERVCLTTLNAPVENMLVRVQDESARDDSSAAPSED
jgi:multidrug efflux system membrane fusion protein